MSLESLQQKFNLNTFVPTVQVVAGTVATGILVTVTGLAKAASLKMAPFIALPAAVSGEIAKKFFPQYSSWIEYPVSGAVLLASSQVLSPGLSSDNLKTLAVLYVAMQAAKFVFNYLTKPKTEKTDDKSKETVSQTTTGTETDKGGTSTTSNTPSTTSEATENTTTLVPTVTTNPAATANASAQNVSTQAAGATV